MRLALLGAFHQPVPQGSQVFALGQARALQAAGADVTLVCYGRRGAQDPPGLPVVRSGAALSPASHRAGPRLAKPLADLSLAGALVRAHRRRPFDAVIAHHAEAALVARALRRSLDRPWVYVAHTVLASELPCYGPSALGALLARGGRWLDAMAAREADAVIALAPAAASALGRLTRSPVELIPPGLDAPPPPDDAAIAAACARHGLTPGRFVLYAGNLDAYQDLDVYAAAARALPRLPFVAATQGPRRTLGPVRVVDGGSPEALRALTWGASVAVLPRRRPGGFPIKLLNYMEAARPIVVRTGLEGALVHGRSGWLVAADAGPDAFAEAIGALVDAPDRARALGRAARDTLVRRHAWPDLAGRTLSLLEQAQRGAHVQSGSAISRTSRPVVETRTS